MTAPKIKPCPRCQTDAHIAIYTYESGWRHVECDKCYYLGPGEGSKLAAIKSHNANVMQPCEFCGDGKRTGLPGNACENCMNTGLKYPALTPAERGAPHD